MQGESERPPAPPSRPSPQPRDPTEIADILLAERYRLEELLGVDTAVDAQFWRANDTVLKREVGLTVLRRRDSSTAPDQPAPSGPTEPRAARATDMLARATRAGRFEHPGWARLLDVIPSDAAGGPAQPPADLPPEVFGFTVNEWVPGTSLAEFVAAGPVRPLTAIQAALPLAAAAALAHQQGLVLGCNHPERIRITPEGRARLAFPMPRPETTAADDIRGLGATLYVLLTGRWPLSGTEAARAGLRGWARAPDGEVFASGTLHPGVPHELTAIINGALGASSAMGRVHTAAAVRQVLEELTATVDQTPLLPPPDDGVPAAPDDLWQESTGERPVLEPERRRNLRNGLVGLGAAVLVVLAFVGVQLGLLFGEGGAPSIVVGDPAAAQNAAGPIEMVGVADIKVYDRAGDRDNSGRVSRVIDGDPRSSWRTFTYRQQFPRAKPGVGLMLSFASPVRLTGLTITSPSEGTRIEVRSAPAADTALAQTQTVTTATLLAGRTELAVPNGQPVSFVLLWITELGGGDGEWVTEIAEVSVRRTA